MAKKELKDNDLNKVSGGSHGNESKRVLNKNEYVFYIKNGVEYASQIIEVHSTEEGWWIFSSYVFTYDIRIITTGEIVTNLSRNKLKSQNEAGKTINC